MATSSSLPPLIGGKFEMAWIVAQWVLMYKHPFKVVEQEGFNNLLKYGKPSWEKISLFTRKNDCHKVYEMEKKRLKAVLKNIDRISLTTDLWNSSNQKLEYMLPHRKLILDFKTRWNSTYKMLATALKFQRVFPRYIQRDQHFTSCPLDEDWDKIERVCEILKVSNVATNIISGSEYPTSNRFLAELCKVKVLLDKHAKDENEFVRTMVRKMKGKFDKYWGECNLLISIAAVLDPRCKMRVLDYVFPKIYGNLEAWAHSTTVRDVLYKLYREYVVESQSSIVRHMPTPGQVRGSGSGSGSGSRSGKNANADSSGWSNLMNYVGIIETIAPEKSELDSYLEDPCYKCEVDHEAFDALKWWQTNSLKYSVLCKVAHDIVVVPITTVASEATFSVGSRVIDNYRS
ncbi:zinc finger BED domain-containing protein RICESLEEPER 1-like [Pistacia vera]|uniref:zinc finger BED domain-containing protein RICESLEEPER 1-like n=1 Tax=Pistacia vera TaxID=55513 RepID=UPI0012639677|nr:zinc finger BED domain-containing protein RICESLEEPER 1-like [Pistacia vera]